MQSLEDIFKPKEIPEIISNSHKASTKVFELSRKLYRKTDEVRIKCTHEHGSSLLSLGKTEDGLQFMKDACDATESIYDSDHWLTRLQEGNRDLCIKKFDLDAKAKFENGFHLVVSGEAKEGLVAMRDACDIAKRVYGADHQLAVSLCSLLVSMETADIDGLAGGCAAATGKRKWDDVFDYYDRNDDE